jgi:hypothetical protein
MDLIFDVNECQTIGRDGVHSRGALRRWLTASLCAEPLPHFDTYRIRDVAEPPQTFVDARLTPEIRRRLVSSTLHVEQRMQRQRPYWYVYFTHMVPTTEWRARDGRFTLAMLSERHALSRELASLIGSYIE